MNLLQRDHNVFTAILAHFFSTLQEISQSPEHSWLQDQEKELQEIKNFPFFPYHGSHGEELFMKELWSQPPVFKLCGYKEIILIMVTCSPVLKICTCHQGSRGMEASISELGCRIKPWPEDLNKTQNIYIEIYCSELFLHNKSIIQIQLDYRPFQRALWYLYQI